LSESRQTIIVGTGSYVPTVRVPNEDFLDHEFFDASGRRIERANADVIAKFQQITGIKERRYVSDDLVASDIATLAAQEALESSGFDRETLDYLIVAHNFGDVEAGSGRSDFCPTLAARTKQNLGIRNPGTVCYDLPFGCPGWLQAMIQADYFLKSGDASSALVIGAETLSRVCDPHDRDSMIYADGAGATLIEAASGGGAGVLAHAARSDTLEYARLLNLGESNKPDCDDRTLFLKMAGHKLYEYALKTVPGLVRECLEKASVEIGEVKKILIHQANDKMDAAIIKRLYKLYGINDEDSDAVPMTISWLGNSSVATVPTLLDLLLKGNLDGHEVESGDLLVFASVGAGMNVNAMAYRMP